MEHVYFDDTDYPIFYFLLLSYKSLKSGCQIIICFLTLWMILFLVVNLHYHFFLANVLCCLAFGNSLHNTVITGWQPLYNNVVRIYTFQITELNMPQILDHEWTDELLFFFSFGFLFFFALTYYWCINATIRVHRNQVQRARSFCFILLAILVDILLLFYFVICFLTADDRKRDATHKWTQKKKYNKKLLSRDNGNI